MLGVATRCPSRACDQARSRPSASEPPNRSVTLQPLSLCLGGSYPQVSKLLTYHTTHTCMYETPFPSCPRFPPVLRQSFAVGVAHPGERATQEMPSGPDAPSPVEGELVAVIERTRAVAERWKALHLREEGMCAELRQLVRKSARSVDSAREMRDKAVEVQKAAQQDAVAAKHEKARWRARADAQSNAKVFLEADRLRGEPSPLPQP